MEKRSKEARKWWRRWEIVDAALALWERLQPTAKWIIKRLLAWGPVIGGWTNWVLESSLGGAVIGAGGGLAVAIVVVAVGLLSPRIKAKLLSTPRDQKSADPEGQRDEDHIHGLTPAKLLPSVKPQRYPEGDNFIDAIDIENSTDDRRQFQGWVVFDYGSERAFHNQVRKDHALLWEGTDDIRRWLSKGDIGQLPLGRWIKDENGDRVFWFERASEVLYGGTPAGVLRGLPQQTRLTDKNDEALYFQLRLKATPKIPQGIVTQNYKLSWSGGLESQGSLSVEPSAAIAGDVMASLEVQAIPSITWDVRTEGNDVFIAITNDDTPRTLSAKIEAVEGGTEALATPWAIPWCDHSSEQRLMSGGETHLLHLVNIDPKGNANEISESGAFPNGTTEIVKFLRVWKPVLLKFCGMSSEHTTYLKDQGNADGWTSILSDWSGRRLRVVVRVRSNDGEVNEVRTAILGITPNPAQGGSSAIYCAKPFAKMQTTSSLIGEPGESKLSVKGQEAPVTSTPVAPTRQERIVLKARGGSKGKISGSKIRNQDIVADLDDKSEVNIKDTEIE